MKLSDYLDFMGITWEIVEKPKHYLIRYNFNGEKSHCLATVKPYKMFTDPLNNIYNKKVNYEIDEIKDILMFNLYYKLESKYKLKKYYPVYFDDITPEFLKKYHHYYAWDAENYIFDLFRDKHAFPIKGVNIKYFDLFKVWLEMNKYDFLDAESYKGHFVYF